MYLVKPLSGDKGSGKFTKYLATHFWPVWGQYPLWGRAWSCWIFPCFIGIWCRISAIVGFWKPNSLFVPVGPLLHSKNITFLRENVFWCQNSIKLGGETKRTNGSIFCRQIGQAWPKNVLQHGEKRQKDKWFHVHACTGLKSGFPTFPNLRSPLHSDFVDILSPHAFFQGQRNKRDPSTSLWWMFAFLPCIQTL